LRIKNPQVAHPLAETKLITVEMEWDDGDRVWHAIVPELRDLATYGKTYEEALDNAAEAICLFLDVAEEHGDPIPISRKRAAELRELLSEVVAS
jgi:predicted RNase H-like HicB family nuclease